MKRKKIILIGALFLALAASVGTYAYAYITALATMAATLGAANIATANVASGQPNWLSLLPHAEGGLEVLRPDGPGDVTNIPKQQPNSGTHWQKVADAAPDDWTTTVYNDKGTYQLDLYGLTNHAQGSGTIYGVIVYFRFTATSGGTAYAQPAIKTGGNTYLGGEEIQFGPNFITKSYRWDSNPATSSLWTWSDIDALQAGIQLYRIGANASAACTQVYVVIDYLTPPIIQGDVPTGNLFQITPSTGYTGDLLGKIYLTNTSALAKAYRYLNIKVYTTNSLEAGQTPNYQVLSMENGVVVFNLVGGSANHTAQVVGGSYMVVSGDSNQWSSGWSLTPELYYEVSAK